LAKQGNADVVKQAGGGLAYRSSGASGSMTADAAIATKAVLYNTLTVPRGGQYHLTLSDGSQVWLNAASSLRYPTTFTSGERRVEITGEAYFEVSANASMPFRVTGGGMEVQVLGTQFDMNAYEDAPFARTTLVKGSVRVGSGDNHFTITPGEQAQLVSGGGIRVLRDADVDGEIAWKEGQFAFEETDLREVMRQVARWYDVEVEYRGEVDGRRFTADISRGRSLSTLLKALEATSNIHFKIQGRQLIVTP
jgi:ferric-dicitrate binding protein FerR (iron transport regulator)